MFSKLIFRFFCAKNDFFFFTLTKQSQRKKCFQEVFTFLTQINLKKTNFLFSVKREKEPRLTPFCSLSRPCNQYFETKAKNKPLKNYEMRKKLFFFFHLFYVQALSLSLKLYFLSGVLLLAKPFVFYFETLKSKWFFKTYCDSKYLI